MWRTVSAGVGVIAFALGGFAPDAAAVSVSQKFHGLVGFEVGACGTRSFSSIALPKGTLAARLAQSYVGDPVYREEMSNDIVGRVVKNKVLRRGGRILVSIGVEASDAICERPADFADGGRLAFSESAPLPIDVRIRRTVRVYLPSCGNSAYSGKVAPGTWDRGCTGNLDLIRMNWRGWGNLVAEGSGRTGLGGTARVRVSRIRRCENASGNLRRFYTRISINGRRYGLICMR